MKKIIAMLLLVAMMATLLVACEDKFTCDYCGEEKSGKGNSVELMGEKGTVCDSCKGEIAELDSALAELEDALADLEDLDLG